MRDHWWWRPEWRVGRHFYACHFAIDRHSELTRLIAAYQEKINHIPGLDLIPARWLHLTMQGIGFVDEVTDEELCRLGESLRGRLATLAPPTITFHRPVVRSEAVYLLAAPAEPVIEVRRAVRTVIADILGADRLPEGPEQVVAFQPHVSLAYSNAEQDARPIVHALAEVEAAPAVITLDQVDLLEFHRDQRMYEWTTVQPLRIGEHR